MPYPFDSHDRGEISKPTLILEVRKAIQDSYELVDESNVPAFTLWNTLKR